MLNAILLLLSCQLAGEVISQYFSIPVPGPVVGMALLLAVFHFVPAVGDMVRETSNTILRNLSLLFVPAGVGVMLHVSTVFDEWLAILVSLVLGTVITLTATALTIKYVSRLMMSRRKERL
jgi:holin-like protein